VREVAGKSNLGETNQEVKMLLHILLLFFVG